MTAGTAVTRYRSIFGPGKEEAEMNIIQAFQMAQQFRNNPQMILQYYGIPQECNSPESVLKYLKDNGKVTQDQINQISGMYNQMFRR